jgi:hypothetical protein
VTATELVPKPMPRRSSIHIASSSRVNFVRIALSILLHGRLQLAVAGSASAAWRKLSRRVSAHSSLRNRHDWPVVALSGSAGGPRGMTFVPSVETKARFAYSLTEVARVFCEELVTVEATTIHTVQEMSH